MKLVNLQRLGEINQCMIKYKKKWYGHFLFFFLREKLKCKLTHSSFRDFETGPAKTLTFSFTSGADLK